MEVHGFCDSAFEPIKDAFCTNFDEGRELGACIAVTHHGRPVVDLWAGHQDRKHTQPWEEDTLALVFSTTKIATNLCAHILMDEGKLDIDKPVVDYWPEFARVHPEKNKITTRDIFLHRTGLPGLLVSSLNCNKS